MKWGVIVGILVLVALWRVAAESDGIRQTEIARRDSAIAVLRESIDSLIDVLDRRVAEVDTVIATRWARAKTKVDTFTVSVPVETVREIVRDADTTINACRRVLGDCRAVVDSQVALRRLLEQQVAALRDGPRRTANLYLLADPAQRLYLAADTDLRLPLRLHLYGRVETRLDSLAPVARVGVRFPL